jgi:hypothetical protein
MISSRITHRTWLVLCLVFAATGAFAQTTATEFKPQVGQAGKDVVWVPSPQALVDRMLDMAKVTPQDFVMDLGSGDGRTVITAAKRGATAVGVEYNPNMVELSRKNAAAEKVTGKATFVNADLFETDISKATVITLFLLPDLNLKLRPRLLDLKPGTRIVSNTFTMGDWTPDERIDAGGSCESWCSAMLWIIPAKVQGTWRLPQGDLALTQTFQMLSGTLKSGANAAPITEAKMNGNQITFTAGGVKYTGRVSGNAMDGTTATGTKWAATRAGTN